MKLLSKKKKAAEKTHPSTLLPLGTTRQDETALQDDRPAACVMLLKFVKNGHESRKVRPTVLQKGGTGEIRPTCLEKGGTGKNSVPPTH